MRRDAGRQFGRLGPTPLDKHGKKVIDLATKRRAGFRSNADSGPPGTEDTKMHTGRFAREKLYDMVLCGLFVTRMTHNFIL